MSLIAAASAGNGGRFISLTFSNRGTAQRELRIYDGTAAAGTIRFRASLAPGSGDHQIIDQAGKSIIPKSQFTAGNAIECNIDAAGDVTVTGDFVREA